MGETKELPSADVLELIVEWLRRWREPIDEFCDKNNIPKPPPT